MNTCCVCGEGEPEDEVAWCEVCGHSFCGYHRWALWGVVERSGALVRWVLMMRPPQHCAHKEDV